MFTIHPHSISASLLKFDAVWVAYVYGNKKNNINNENQQDVEQGGEEPWAASQIEKEKTKKIRSSS